MTQIEAAVIMHSIPEGVTDPSQEILTFELTFPRIILAEFNTHRMFSRNTASSRAIPVNTRLAQVLENPYIPVKFGVNQKGMSSGEEVKDTKKACDHWMEIVSVVCDEAKQFYQSTEVHKEFTNRVFESFSHVTVVMTSGWLGLNNFFQQRLNPGAQPEIRILAAKMALKAITSTSTPRVYHTPYVPECPQNLPFYETEDFLDRSSAICASVSYGRPRDDKSPKDLQALAQRLKSEEHPSPFEHVAIKSLDFINPRNGNLPVGWTQYRHCLSFGKNHHSTLSSQILNVIQQYPQYFDSSEVPNEA